jgi:hypothetical protein
MNPDRGPAASLKNLFSRPLGRENAPDQKPAVYPRRNAVWQATDFVDRHYFVLPLYGVKVSTVTIRGGLINNILITIFIDRWKDGRYNNFMLNGLIKGLLVVVSTFHQEGIK